MANADEWVTLEEAQEWLGVSTRKLRKLLKLGAEGKPGGLPWEPDPLDGRAKRIRASDVEKLLRASPAKSVA
jgi:hypothetical protein